MKKLESSLKNMVFVLTGTTVICVALLAYVNLLTAKPIAKANANILNTALKQVLPAYDNNPVTEADTVFGEKDGKKTVKYIIYPAKNNNKLVGTAVKSESLGFGGELTVLVGFQADGKVYGYSVLSHSETPGLGSKSVSWFKKGSKGDIIGMNPGEKPLIVKKDGGQVDAITAATITSRAFLRAVNSAYEAFKNNGEKPNGMTGATKHVEPSDSISTK